MDFLEKYEEEQEEKKSRTFSFTCSSRNKEIEKPIMDYVEKLEKRNIPYGKFMKKVISDYIKGINLRVKDEFIYGSNGECSVESIEVALKKVLNESTAIELSKAESLSKQIKEQSDLIAELKNTIEKQNKIISSLVEGNNSLSNREQALDMIDKNDINSNIDKKIDEEAQELADSLPEDLGL